MWSIDLFVCTLKQKYSHIKTSPHHSILHMNQIGDDGAMALAEAVGKGALPKLKGLFLGGNKLSQTAKDAWEAVKAKRSGLRVQI